MNDTERLTRLHTNLINELASNLDVQLRRAGLETEEYSILTFFQLFFDPADLTSWISRYRSCVNHPIPQITIGANADLWNKLYAACANIGIDWPGKENFITRKAKNFQAKFDESIRKRYSRENEEIVKLQDQLRTAKEQIKNAASQMGDMQVRMDEMQSLLAQTEQMGAKPADIASFFHERIALFTEQYDACANRLDEYREQERAIQIRMTAISESIHQAKSITPQLVQILEDTRSEYNDVFDAMKSMDEDTEQLNDAHQKVVAAAQKLHKHQVAIQEFDTLYVAEGNAITAVRRNIEAMPLQKEYLEKALQTLLVAGKLLGFDGEVELESIFQAFPDNSHDTHEDSEAEEEGVLTKELISLLDGMTLVQLIGPRSIKVAREAAGAYKLESVTEFVQAVISCDLETQLNEAVSKRKRGISKESARMLLSTTIPNLKKRWMSDGSYDREKMRSHFVEKLDYKAVYGREQSPSVRETA